MGDVKISADNFLELFTSTLKRLALRTGDCCPAEDFSAIEMYMLAIAHCLGLSILDNTVGATSWIRLTPLGKRWLENPTPLDQMKARVPVVHS